MPFSFWGFFVPNADANLESAKSALEDGDNELAERHLDSAEQTLRKARKQTEEQIQKRNSGEYDPEDYYEGDDWGQSYKKGRKNGG